MSQARHSNLFVVTLLIALQLIILLLVVLLTLASVAQWHTLDLMIYYGDAGAALSGRIPYRDFGLEYPPLALLPFVLPRLAAFGQLDFSRYIWLFLVQSALLSTLVALALVQGLAAWQPQRRPIVPLALYVLLVGITAPLLPWRYDLFPALLTILGLLCVWRARPAWAGFWLGLGVSAKLYPIVLLPLVGAYYLAGKDWRALLRLALGSALALELTLLPFVLAAPGQILSFLQYHAQRGLQLESLPAGAIVLASALGFTKTSLAFNYGALHIVSPLAPAMLRWLPLAFVLVFGAVLACGLARFRAEQRAQGAIASSSLAAYAMAALLAFIATNKVFSPQYVIWLLPLAPLLRPRHTLALLLICAITISLFPFDYNNLLAMQLMPVLLLNMRNLLVVGLLIWLLLDYAPGRATGRPDDLL